MSKLSCVCGYVIRDQQGNLPYKGRIIRDQHLESLFDSVVEDLNKFISAKVETRGQAWLAQHIPAPYPSDATDKEIIYDLIAGYFLLRYGLDIYQCENCGRVWIQDRHLASHFRLFTPEGAWEDLLAVLPDE